MNECTISPCVNYCCKMCWSSCPKRAGLCSPQTQQTNREIECYRFDIFKNLFPRNYLRAQTQPASWLFTLTCQILRAKGWMILQSSMAGREVNRKLEERCVLHSHCLSPALEVIFSSCSFPNRTQMFLAQLPWCPSPVHTCPAALTPSSMLLGMKFIGYM